MSVTVQPVTTPPIAPAFDWGATQSARRKETESLHDQFCKAVKGVATRVVCKYDGYGDSGSVQSVDFYKGRKRITAPETKIEIVRGPLLSIQSQTPEHEVAREKKPLTLMELAEELAYYALEVHAPGWENNEGAHGTVTVNATGLIRVNHYCRYDDTEKFEYSQALSPVLIRRFKLKQVLTDLSALGITEAVLTYSSDEADFSFKAGEVAAEANDKLAEPIEKLVVWLRNKHFPDWQDHYDSGEVTLDLAGMRLKLDHDERITKEEHSSGSI